MLRISHRLLRYSGHIFQHKKNDVIIFQSYAIVSRGVKDDSSNSVSKLFQPATIKEIDVSQIGLELTGKINKPQLLNVLNTFSQKNEIINLCKEHGLDDYIRQKSFASFRRYCFDLDKLPTELYIKIYDIVNGAAHSDDLFPYFLKHAREIYPHLECMTDLKKISDLSNPATWYPEARVASRRIIFHGGPTNSGKTYQAMQRFLSAESGIYCGPLKMLAVEVYMKSNQKGTPCDLVTGEERRLGHADGTPANHISCTVEMTALNRKFEVAIIDEIQLLKDPSRGWAWTRAFLGINADEVHVCGEAGTLDLLEKICNSTGEIIETNTYERLTKLTIENEAIKSLDNLQPGDCIVCFNKNDLYSITTDIEASGREVAVIYGSLPPNTKIAQAAKFNNPNHECKIMVATDAIGMGINLSIRRMIFYSLIKPSMNEKGEKEMSTLSISSTLQIAGRAGRFGTQWEHGYVTTFKQTDLPTLQYLLAQAPEPITKAGLHPTAEQIELYAYHLPSSTLSNLMDIFLSLSTVDDLYFMCSTEDFKFLADMVQHIPLSLRARYVFCCAPINRKMTFVCAMFSKFATQYSKYEPITFEFVAMNCGFPMSMPKNLAELVHLECVFDVLDTYLWLSYRFSEMFPHVEQIRNAQVQLDQLIQEGVLSLTQLLKNVNGENSEIGSKLSTYLNVRVGKSKAAGNNSYLSGRVTVQMLTEGIITPALLNQLHEEWANSKNNVNKIIPEVTTQKSKENPREKTRDKSQKGKKGKKEKKNPVKR